MRNVILILVLLNSSYTISQSSKYSELIRKAKESEIEGNYKESIKVYTKVIMFYPKAPYPYFSRAKSKIELKDYRGAILDLSKTIENINRYPESYNRMLTISEFKGYAYHNRGISKIKLKNYREAILDFEKSINLLRSYVVNYFELADAKEELEDYKGALKVYDSIVSKFRKASIRAIVYYKRAFLKYKMMDINSACLDWSRAGELGIDDAYEQIQRNCQ